MSLRALLTSSSLAKRGIQTHGTVSAGRGLQLGHHICSSYCWPRRGGWNRSTLVHTCRQYSIVMEPPTSTIASLSPKTMPSLWNDFILLIKRTFQPSIIRKRRKTGFLTRHKTVGGRRVLERRARKGRARMGGC